MKIVKNERYDLWYIQKLENNDNNKYQILIKENKNVIMTKKNKQ